MTTISVRPHQPHDHTHIDPSSPELDHQTSSLPTEEEDAHVSSVEEHSAEFTAECQRLGLPLDTAKRIQRRNQRFEDKWWRDMQVSVNSKDTKENDPGGLVKIASTEEILARRTLINDTSGVGGEQIQQSVQSPSLTEDAVASAKQLLRQTKAEAIDAIRSTQGDTSNPRFVAALKALTSLYRGMKNQPGAQQDLSSDFEGQWTMLSRPNFRDGLGQNRRGDFVYTLGRMAFGMFRPTELRCSIQRILNTTAFVGPDDELPESVPRSLRKQIQDLRAAIRQSGTTCTDATCAADGSQASILRTYDIEVEFCIEPKDEDDVIASQGRRLSSASSSDSLSSHSSEHSYSAPSKPLRAKMITNGYLLPDPENKDRLTVWFTSGTIMPVRETGEEEAEKRKRKKKSTKKKKHSAKDKAEGGQSLSSIKESVCDHCKNSCPLLLHECRRENKQCPLHGQKKLSSEYRHKMKARVQKYVRPKSYGIYVPHKTGLSVGDMVDAPFDSEWEDIFAPEATWKKSWGESAKLLAAKMLLGAELPDHMEEDGSMSYSLHRPIGGHGTTFVDVLYLDEDLRITRGNAGSVFVQVKQNHKPSSGPTHSVTTTPKPKVQAGRHNKATAA